MSSMPLAFRSLPLSNALTWVVSAVISFAGVLPSGLAVAADLEETWFIDRTPGSYELEQWKKKPGVRHYRFSLNDATSAELEALLELPNADRVEVQLDRQPTPDLEGALIRLARRYPGKFHLVTLEGLLPAASQAALFDRLNRISPARMTFVITGPQDPDDSAALARLKFPTQVTYATRVFPRYADRPSWDRIPETTPLLVSTDYWPMYTAMDLLNLLKMPQRIRIKDTFPTADALPYVRAIRRLEEVAVDTNFDPSGSFRWEDFGNAVLVRWNRREVPPANAALADFCRTESGQRRKLVFDRDGELTAGERSALQGCADRIAVEWIHAP